jgi:hypothetical protein
MAGGIVRAPKTAKPRAVPVEDVEPDDEPEPLPEPESEPEAEFEPAFDAEPDAESDLEPAFEPLADEPVDEDPVDFEPTPVIRTLPPGFDDHLPDPEDLEYIDDDDATPGRTGDKGRPADD